MTTRSYDKLYKLLIFGDANTGKSGLMDCFVGEEFNTVYIPTIGIDFKYRTIVLDGVKVKLQVWDTAGEHRFTTGFYKGAAITAE